MQSDRQKNKRIANLLLAVFFLLFTAATILKNIYRDNFAAGLFAFTAEAALIGGIADWFAVTALFKKPLGFSWHTAIIPNNRDKIAESISVLVSKQLLSVDAVKTTLGTVDLSDTLINGILGRLERAMLQDKFQSFLGNGQDIIDSSKLAAMIDRFIKEGLKKEELSEDIRTLLINTFEEGKHKKWLSDLIEKAISIARKDSTREKIYKLLREQERYNESQTGAGSFFVRMLLNMSRNSRHSNLFNIAGMLQQELISTLEELNDPAHPVFVKLAENASSLLSRLDKDRVLMELLQSWKNGVLERIELLEALRLILASAAESDMRRQEAAGWLADNIDNYRNRLKNDEKIRNSTDELLRTMLQKIIVNEHHLIGEIAKETLSAFTDEKLNRFINDKVGNDLQWIRINGSIVGAAAGALVYLFINLLYSPYLQPLLNRMVAN